MPELDENPRAAHQPDSEPPGSGFHDLARYVALPRTSGLALSPDGRRLVTSVASPSADGKKYVTALWEIDPAGIRAPRRLTRSAPGESQPAFLPGGDLLFISKRPDGNAPTGDPAEEDVPSLWLLPETGEPRQLAARPGGVGQVVVAQDTGDIVVTAAVLPGAKDAEDDRRLRAARREAGVTAILHDSFPVRYWDHDLGPDQLRVFAGGTVRGDDNRLDDARDLTPDPRGRIKDGLAVSPDGRRVAVVAEIRDDLPTAQRDGIILLDARTGQPGRTVQQADHSFTEPAFSPDGAFLICVREYLGAWDDAPRCTLHLVDLGSGDERDPLVDSPL